MAQSPYRGSALAKMSLHPGTTKDLRRRAEHPTEITPEFLPDEWKALSSEETLHLLHELHAHQIELELQNEELRRTQQSDEATLAETIDLLERTGAMAKVGGWELDLRTQQLSWSLETFRIHELDPPVPPPLEDAITFYPLEARSAIQAALRGGMEHGTPWDLELPLVTAKGRSIWVRAQGFALMEGGQPVKLLGAIQDLTERKQAEETLRQSEARFRDIVQVIGDWIWEVDAEGRYTFASGSVQLLLGYPAEEIIGKTPFDFMPPEEAARVGAIFAELASRKENFRDLENLNLNQDGSLRHILTTGVSILGQGGELLGYRGVDRDITEHKQAESYREMGRDILQILNEPGDLQESIQRILATLKARTGFDAVGIRLQEGEDFPYWAQIGFPKDFLKKENTLIERTSAGGVCRDEDGKVCLECTCGLVIEGKTDPANPLFTPGGSAWTNDSFLLLDLSPRNDPRNRPRNRCIHQGFASIALVPILSKDKVVGLIQLNDRRKGRFTLEVVEYLEEIALHIGSALLRKQAEETLRESEERYRVMIDYAPEAILVYDVDATTLVDVNPNAETLLGIAKEHLLGRDIREFILDENPTSSSQPEDLRHHLELALSGQDVGFERLVRGSRGDYRHCEVRLVRLPSKSRNFIRASLIDITDRRQHELLVGEMKSLAAKGNVAAYIAHEINNPLAGIRNSFRLVARAIPKDHPHFPFTEVITKELDRIANIIRTIYSLYRTNPTPTRVVVLDETLNDVIQLLSSMAKGREITLELIPTTPPIRGLIPEDLLRQALFNLIQNAIDATPPGGRVTCSGRLDGNELIVQVQDTGAGISEELGAKIFEPGVTTKKAIELSGLGLGLDTCRKLMEAVGGSIAFENIVPGPGTLFSLHFPWNDD